MARKRGGLKSFKALWLAHEKLYQEIFARALEKLKPTKQQCKHEDRISEALGLILVEVCFEDERDVTTPYWECPKNPVNTDELKGGKKSKIPDFTCKCLDANADSAETYEIPLHIECKKLGKKQGSWNLNRNYVRNGIFRFDTTSHEYGKRASSGMMIGYIINTDPKDILEDVNQYLNEYIPQLNFTFSRKISSCEQPFSRKQVKPASFKLIHLWKDFSSVMNSV